MKKSVFVMDTPEMCMGCPFAWPADDYSYICIIAEDKDGDFKAINYDLYAVKVEDWCPLRPLPEKREYINPVSNIEANKNIIAVGWNTCIDEIIGGEE